MPPIRTAHLTLWVAYALTALVHLGSLLAGAEVLQRSTQTLFGPLLIGVLLTAVPRLSRTVVLILIGLGCATFGDTLSQLNPGAVQQISAAFFLLALVFYAAALLPLWNRNRDPMRIALAIPYGGVVIGLFIAFADNAGGMLPLVAAYAVTLATMAFLAAGGNGLTWTGGTLFLLSSSLLAMDWFLPGAAIASSQLWVMLTYALGHGLLIAGMIQAIPTRRWAPRRTGSASLVIVES